MYDESNSDFRAAKEGWTHHAVVDHAAFDAGLEARYGKPFSLRGGFGGAAGNPVGFLMMLAYLPFIVGGFIFLIPAFPIAGFSTLILGLLIAALLGGPGVSDFILIVAALLPCLICFGFMYTVEQTASHSPRYRRVRHVIRVAGYAFLANEFFNPWSTGRRIAPADPFGPSFSLLRVMIIVVTAVAAHYGFRWLDRRDKRFTLWQSLRGVSSRPTAGV